MNTEDNKINIIVNEYNEKIIIKTKLTFNHKDFTLIGFTSVLNIYANRIAISKCPMLIDNMINGTTMITIVATENTTNIILVQKTVSNKFGLVNPGGLFSSRNESFEQCAIREMCEETGLVYNSENVTECGEFETDYFCYDEKWHNLTKIFTVTLNMSEADLNNNLTHKD